MRSEFDLEKTMAPERAEQQMIREAQAYTNKSGLMQAGCEMSESEKVAQLFRYHPPESEDLAKYAAINQAAKNFAEVVLANCPSGDDRRTVIACIRNARMFANAAIALHGLSLGR